MDDVQLAWAVSILVSVTSAIITSLLAARRYKLQIQADLQKEYESRFNERKWEIYIGFSDIIRKLMESTKAKNLDKNMPKIISGLYEFTGKLWIVGSDDVVRSYNNWRALSQKAENAGSEEKMKMMVDMMQIVIEMRKDLGYSNSKIGPEDLLPRLLR